MPAFCDALRNCKSLKTLALNGVELWDDMVVAGQLILAMMELPVLQEVSLCRNSMDETPDQRAVGECLAYLVAHSSSLRILRVDGNNLGEAGMALPFLVMHFKAGLEMLNFDGSCSFEEFSADFARKVILPAVRANKRLRRLYVPYCMEDSYGMPADELRPAMEEVKNTLKARRLADEEAA